ncbi:MAG: ABC transporter substrate-binding protein [Acidimicrobiales bacterium]|nr:ABC transporter substrate-binding protein [Acidimicrobiales bacterium]
MIKKMFAIVAAGALLVAACGSDSDSAGGTDDSKETITLIVNPWSASRLNVEVAKNIIESELGNPVEISEVDENDAMFTGMADGTLDAVLEIWPSGITDAENKFFEDGSVEQLGDLGAIGRIGWFVPRYVIEDNPDLASWEGYKDPANAALFATAETGDKGRFLGTDPSYSEFDAQIIENLELPFEVQFSGSEPATVAELDSRVAAGEPILMYWWEPTAAVSKYDLVKVALPPFTEECGASQASGDGGVDCDYPEDPIIKAASAQLKDKDPDVYAFLKAFSLSNEDQLSMLPAMEIDGEDPADVAAEWVDANADKWKAWLPS